MRLATKYGFYTILQIQPPDDGEAAVYQVRARACKDLENLLAATGLCREISDQPGTDCRYRFPASQQEVFEIMFHLVESLDYDHFQPEGPEHADATA
jgi:hypothetical protein